MRYYEETFQDTTIGEFVTVDPEVQAYSDKHGILQGYDRELHTGQEILFFQLRGDDPNTPLAKQLSLLGDDNVAMGCVEKPGEMRTVLKDTRGTAYGSAMMVSPATDVLAADDTITFTWSVNPHADARRWTSAIFVPADHKIVENAVLGHSDRWYTLEGMGLVFHCGYTMGTIEASIGSTPRLVNGKPDGTFIPTRMNIPTDWSGAVKAKSGYRRATAPGTEGFPLHDETTFNGPGLTEEDYFRQVEFKMVITGLQHVQVYEAGQLVIDYTLPVPLPPGSYRMYNAAHLYHSRLELVEDATRRGDDSKEDYIVNVLGRHDIRIWGKLRFSINGATSNIDPRLFTSAQLDKLQAFVGTQNYTSEQTIEITAALATLPR